MNELKKYIERKCKIVKDSLRHGGDAPECSDRCMGYGNGRDDEPIDACKKCKFNVWYGEE